MGVARILGIADLFATELERFLKQTLPQSTVTREYVPDVTDASFDAWIASLTPMAGFVVPVTYRDELFTRADDQSDYTLALIFAEKCTDTTATGRPPKAWMDKRVGLVAAALDYFGDARNAFNSDNGLLWASEVGLTLVFDAGVYESNGAFWSTTTITLREIG